MPLSVETWNERNSGSAPTPRAPARPGRLRVELGLADTLLQLWRAKWLMLLVFLPIVLIGIAIALSPLVPTMYPASTRLLVRLGQEYAFDPVVGDAAKGAFPRQEDLLRSETELARSPVIAERVIERVGLNNLYPDIASARTGASATRASAIEARAIERFGKDLSVAASPRSSILHLIYRHREPQLAADTLNAFVMEYLNYRREVLAGGGVAGLSEQRGAIEDRLKTADDALRDYLYRNRLTDFDVETAAAARLYADISDELSRVEASLREAEARAEGLRRQMQSTSREVDLYVETTSEQELEKLRLERESLLSRYRPDSRAVQDADKRIAQLESFIRSTPATGLKRIGPNPTWQALEADAAIEAANIAALTAKARELARQKTEAEDKFAALAAFAPEYQRLKRDRDALEASAGTFATREQTERARSELAFRSVDNISVYEAARLSASGASLKQAVTVAAAVLAALAALVVGLFRAGSVRSFPTAGSVERTLHMPVLASVRNRS